MGTPDDPRKSDALLHSCQSDSVRGGWPLSTFPCMEWITNCWHVPGWSWRMDHQSCAPGPQGRPSCSFKDYCTKRGSPIQVQGTLDSAWQVQLTGPENGTSGSDCKCSVRGPLSYCGCSNGEEDEGQGAGMPLKVWESHPVLGWLL